MKNVFFFGPFLWLRRVVLFVLAMALLGGFILFFLANSPMAIKKAADTFAGDYNISYDDIKGNALTGIEIVNPKFKDEKLANNLLLKWNPSTLAAKRITVSKLHVKDGNLEVIKGLIASFNLEDNSTKTDSNKSSFDFIVNVKDINLSLEAFTEQNVHVFKVSLVSDTLNYSDDGLNIEGLDFNLDTNVTDISLHGELKNRIVTLSDVNLSNVNLGTLISLFSSEDNTSVKKNETNPREAENVFMPKIVNIKNLKTNILPVTFEPVKMKQIELVVRDLIFDVENLVVKDAVVDINASSNLTNLIYKGNIQGNHLLGKINLKPNNRLYEMYGLPLRKEAITNIEVDFNASTESLMADVRANGKHILKSKNSTKSKGEFNVDVDSFKSHVEYIYSSSLVKADTRVVVSTPYAKNIIVSNMFKMDGNISYDGEIKAENIEGFDAKFLRPLKDIKVKYTGDEKSIYTVIDAKNINGTFDSKDFKTAKVHLETKKPLLLQEFVELPKELQATKANLVLDAPLDFNSLTNIKAKVNMTSNVANANFNVDYGKDIVLKGIVSISKESLLKAYSSDVKWEALSNIDTVAKLSSENLALQLKAKALNIDINYGLKQGNVKGKVILAGLTSTISGNTKETLKVKTKIKAMKSLGKSLASLYAIDDLPPIKGEIDASLLVSKMQTAELTLNAPKLIYQADKKTKHTIKDVKLVASMDDSSFIIKSYKATLNKQKYFSTKKAVISLGESINVSNFWVNDTLLIAGDYNTQRKKGFFTAKAKRFEIKDKVASIQAKIDININLDGDSTDINGKVVLLNGKLTPNLKGKTFASDSDIIILQHMKKKTSSPFMDKLSLAVQIETKEPLRLKQGAINLRLKPDFMIMKGKKLPLQYIGSVEVVKGGSYIFEKKRFVLRKSYVYFTGDVNKPKLDIKVNHKSMNHLITVAITGNPAEPNINFSSSPSLSREQILSLILFDSEAGGDAHSGNEMMRMMGGAMAKSALSDAGIEVDHLAFGEGNSIEVGKKISSKATVIYINGEVPQVKLKYQHGKRTESVMGVSEESQSYDIVYKRDF